MSKKWLEDFHNLNVNQKELFRGITIDILEQYLSCDKSEDWKGDLPWDHWDRTVMELVRSYFDTMGISLKWDMRTVYKPIRMSISGVCKNTVGFKYHFNRKQNTQFGYISLNTKSKFTKVKF